MGISTSLCSYRCFWEDHSNFILDDDTARSINSKHWHETDRYIKLRRYWHYNVPVFGGVKTWDDVRADPRYIEPEFFNPYRTEKRELRKRTINRVLEATNWEVEIVDDINDALDLCLKANMGNESIESTSGV